MAVANKTLRTREDWINAAIAALADGGEAALAVEPMAARLGVSKGSFYWHFADRAALLAAVLEAFEQRAALEPIRALSAESDAATRLRALFGIALDRVSNLLAERALMGSTQPAVRVVIERVHAHRREFLRKCYRELGLDAADATLWATSAYAVFLGAVQLAGSAPFDSDRALRKWTEHVSALLLPSVTTKSTARKRPRTTR